MHSLLPGSNKKATTCPVADIFPQRVTGPAPKELRSSIRDLELGRIPVPKLSVSSEYLLIPEEANVVNYKLCVYAHISEVEVNFVPLTEREDSETRRQLQKLFPAAVKPTRYLDEWELANEAPADELEEEEDEEEEFDEDNPMDEIPLPEAAEDEEEQE